MGEGRSLSVYVGAHNDDWILFRGEQAARDMADPTRRVVLIFTTAGDAGQSDGYWEARELATVLAVHHQLGRQPITISCPRIHGHRLQRYACGAVSLYFLRCHDGGKQGKGFPASGRRSLRRLRESGRRLGTADGGRRYRSWADLCRTLERLIERERRLELLPGQEPVASADTWIHCGDYAGSTNPGDHADHQATAEAIRSFAAGAGYGRCWCLTYCSRERPATLTAAAAAGKRALFEHYGQELGRLLNLEGSAVNQQEWQWWGLKSYARRCPPGSEDPEEPAAPLAEGVSGPPATPPPPAAPPTGSTPPAPAGATG